MTVSTQRASWLRALLVWAAILSGAFGVGLLAANLADYYHFRRAIRAAQRTPPQDWARIRVALAAASKNSARGYFNLARSAMPPEMRRLWPTRASGDWVNAQISLYDLGYLYVFLAIDLADGRVMLCENSRGEQRQEVLWVADAARAAKLNPGGRVISLLQWTMSGGREWVVLPHELRSLERYGSGGDELTASVPLDAATARAIAEEITRLARAIPSGRYRAKNVFDGITLTFRPSADGTASEADIALENVWREECGPLVARLNALLPAEAQINYASAIDAMDRETGHVAQVEAVSWAEAWARELPRSHWWWLWRPQNPLDQQIETAGPIH